jgi:hypothetical protein
MVGNTDTRVDESTSSDTYRNIQFSGVH